MLSRVKEKGKTDQVVKLAGDQPNNWLKTERSQMVAKNFARSFRTACQQVLKSGGAAADN